MTSYEAYIGRRLVRTFSHPDLAQAYADRMAALDCVVVIKPVRLRRAA